MPFQVCYTGDASTINVYSSTPRTKGDEFYDKMDALMSKGPKKLEEMLELCKEYFEDGVAKDEGGIVDYEEFNSWSDISVDDEKIDMGAGWNLACKKQKSEPANEHKNLIKKNGWCVVYTVQNKRAWEADIDEGEFDKEKLNWKDSMVHYGDTPIDEDIAGRRPIAEEICLSVDYFHGHGIDPSEDHYF